LARFANVRQIAAPRDPIRSLIGLQRRPCHAISASISSRRGAIFISSIYTGKHTHYFTLEAFGFRCAEVFIFIPASPLPGLRPRLAKKGACTPPLSAARAWQLYVAHVFLFVIFIAEVSYTATTFKNPMYNEEMRVADFLDEPHVAVVQALLLQFSRLFSTSCRYTS